MEQSKKMAYTVWEALDDKKAEEITIIEIREISILSDYFIIASGGSTTQIQAMIHSVQEHMHEAGYDLNRVEGNRESAWVLMDYGDVVVHLFPREERQFYNLEHIWSDGKRVTPQLLKH